MAQKNKIKNFKFREHKIKLVVMVLLTCLLVVSFFFSSQIESALGLKANVGLSQVTYGELSSSDFLVEYIDVGQGNSTFITLNDGTTILVDGGNTQYGKTVADFVVSRGVTQIDYLIATHADADHIGGLNYVLEKLEVKNILRPFQISGTGTSAETFVPSEYEDLAETYEYLQEKTNNRSKISRVTSLVYANFIENIYTETYTEDEFELNSTVTVFYDGLTISGEGYLIEFYAPLVHEEGIDLSLFSEKTFGYATVGYGTTDSNDCSAIFTLCVCDETFLFTGDAPFMSTETEIPTSGYEEIDFINSLTDDEVLKLSGISVFLAGHHGSKYSSGETLLAMIMPKFCVVSVGNNSYGQPTSEALSRLNKYKTCKDDVLITMTAGTISFGVIDGKLVYAIEAETEATKVTISWYLLGTIIYIVIAVLVISAKSPRKTKCHK